MFTRSRGDKTGEAARGGLQRLIAKLPEWRLPLLEKPSGRLFAEA